MLLKPASRFKQVNSMASPKIPLAVVFALCVCVEGEFAAQGRESAADEGTLLRLMKHE